MSHRILVVDDDLAIRTLLANGLAEHGYIVETAASAVEMDRWRKTHRFDLVILDVMMPGEDGLSACARLASEGGPPVILLSARGEETDRIAGLETGAGHYLVKPCSTREVVAHVAAALRTQRQSPVPASDVLHFAGWRVNVAARELYDADGTLIDLTDGEFSVLRVFLERPRRVLSRDTLLEAARGPDSAAFDRAVDVQISRLRRKLGAPGDEIIRTVRNEGYLFVPDVRRA